MAGFTNRGKARLVECVFRNQWNGGSIPTNFYVALCTSATAPDADTNVMSDLTEIAAGHGYTSGGYSLTKWSTDFDTLTEDDSSDYGAIEIKDVTWTASGGSIPSSGSGARYSVLTDDNSTVANREIIAYWDLGSDTSVSDGQTITLLDMTLKLSET